MEEEEGLMFNIYHHVSTANQMHIFNELRELWEIMSATVTPQIKVWCFMHPYSGRQHITILIQSVCTFRSTTVMQENFAEQVKVSLHLMVHRTHNIK